MSLNATKVNAKVNTSKFDCWIQGKATGIYPLNSNEVLKRLPDENADNSFNQSVFNDSVLKLLRENCGVGVKHK